MPLFFRAGSLTEDQWRPFQCRATGKSGPLGGFTPVPNTQMLDPAGATAALSELGVRSTTCHFVAEAGVFAPADGAAASAPAHSTPPAARTVKPLMPTVPPVYLWVYLQIWPGRSYLVKRSIGRPKMGRLPHVRVTGLR
jgi:hypothetical protein